MFSKLTNAYCLVAIGGSENFYRFPLLSFLFLFLISNFLVVIIIITVTPLLIYLFIDYLFVVQCIQCKCTSFAFTVRLSRS